MAADKNESDKTVLADDAVLQLRLEEAKAAAPVLVVISGTPLGKSFSLAKAETILGRDPGADISIGESSISRRHSAFRRAGGAMLVCDLGSTNGTFVNDARLGAETMVELRDGDLVRCGSTLLKFLREGNIENVHYGKLYDLATRDGLTGVLNKKAILELLGEQFARSQARGSPLALAMFDIDHFKKINDTYGHPAGDHVLRETCGLIANKVVRDRDALGRYGGEEFSLVLGETPLEIAADIAERIRATIERQVFLFDDEVVPVTVSIGVAACLPAMNGADDLIALADKALYDAKNSGRNCVRVR